MKITRESLRDYAEYVKDMTEAWEIMKGGAPQNAIIDGLFASREYTPDRKGMRKVLREVDLGYVFPQTKPQSKWTRLGLLDKQGRLLLKGRYVVPIRDIMGGIVALVGWWDDSRKYITCASNKYFSKSKYLFGMEQAQSLKKGEGCCLCEGIFDCLAIRSTGMTGYSVMGSDLSNTKSGLLDAISVGNRILAIPDNDTVGNKTVESDGWKIKGRGSYLRWNPEVLGKDIDDAVSRLGEENGRKLLQGALMQRQSVVRLYL